MVRVAHGLVEGEEHWLAGVDGSGRLAFSGQRSHRGDDICSNRTGHMGQPAICCEGKKSTVLT